MEYPGFIGPSFALRSKQAANARTINLFTAKLQAQGQAKSDYVLLPIPGCDLIWDLPKAPCRGVLEHAGRFFAVSGDTFYELFENGTYTARGTVAFTNTDPVTMVTNGDGGNQVFITSSDRGYIYDLGTHAFTTVLTSGATMGDMLDGYFLQLDAATSTFYLSDLLDGLVWDPLMFAQRSTAPDPWVAMKAIFREVWLFGRETSEVWYNAGDFPFPFSPNPSGLISFGIEAKFSPANVAGTMIWLARTKKGENLVVRASGFTPERISNEALEQTISGYSRTDDAIGQSYEMDGHAFYTLTFPTAGITHVYDVGTNEWHERGTWNHATNAYEAWRPTYHAIAFGENIAGDRLSGKIYRLNPLTRTDVESKAIRWVRQAPPLWNRGRMIEIENFELFTDSGQGTLTGLGADPTVELEVSRDGGITWGPPRPRSAGAMGKYKTRVRWEQLGQGRNVALRVSGTDPVGLTLIGGEINNGGDQ